MNENLTSAPTSDLPPILPTQPATDAQSSLDGLYRALRRLPARDTDRPVLGGVCATLAQRLGVAPVAVRAAAVLLAVFGGVGVGLYVIAWTLMPDGSGRSHLEQGLRHGRGRSLLVLALGSIAALGVLGGGLAFLAGILPELLGLAVLVAAGVWAWGRISDRRAQQPTT